MACLLLSRQGRRAKARNGTREAVKCSRAASARGSRATSTAQEELKKRKIEEARKQEMRFRTASMGPASKTASQSVESSHAKSSLRFVASFPSKGFLVSHFSLAFRRLQEPIHTLSHSSR